MVARRHRTSSGARHQCEISSKAAALLPPEPWDGETWRAWLQAVKEATGAKGRALFHPLRLALTGLDAGPELARLLPFIGRGAGESTPRRKNRA
ncbi:MAG: hypothetical protein R3E48_23115 [Burkholderiaceae bacterium]